MATLCLKRLFYLWRLFWTLVAFPLLSIGGFLLATTFIPLITLFVGEQGERHRRAQRVIREAFRAYLALLQILGLMKIEVVGREKLRDCRGKLIIANHPTLIDIVLLIAALPKAKCVVKAELFASRMMRSIVSAAGYISNACDPEVLIEKCRSAIEAGDNVVIFPEGTRSVPGQPLHFQRGFAHIATITGALLQPIVITCEPITLVKGESYFKIPKSRPTFRLVIQNEIDPQFFLKHTTSRSRGARALTTYLEQVYQPESHNA
ncbi:MAG TPA: lysophospholipid acyltransferase family protein [Candidatus Binataceae bacterium]|nr:lysophospholipid acyltransferase family protein [Candidatus Binataceae bacterium]